MSGISQTKNTSLAGLFIPAKVINNDDPLHQERVQIRVPVMHDATDDADLPWAYPVKIKLQGSTSSVGAVGIPVNGTDVIVVFQQGNKHEPLYIGTLTTGEDLIAELLEDYPHTWGFKDAAGNLLKVNTAANTFHFKTGSNVVIDTNADGKLSITVPDDVVINADGNAVIETSGNATLTVGGNTTIASTGPVAITAPSVSVN